MQYEVYNNDRLLITTTESLHLNHIAVLNHTFNLSRMPWVYSCKIFLASVKGLTLVQALGSRGDRSLLIG